VGVKISARNRERGRLDCVGCQVALTSEAKTGDPVIDLRPPSGAAIRKPCRIAGTLAGAVTGAFRSGRAIGRPPLCRASNLNQAWLSFFVYVDPAIHFTRPILSEQQGMNGRRTRSTPSPSQAASSSAGCPRSVRSGHGFHCEPPFRSFHGARSVFTGAMSRASLRISTSVALQPRRRFSSHVRRSSERTRLAPTTSSLAWTASKPPSPHSPAPELNTKLRAIRARHAT
jgi:hypothetical protein